MIVFKSVKPGRLRADAFRLEVLSELHKSEREIKKDFEMTVKNWETEVVFDSAISTRGGNLEVFVGTDNDIYALVSRGAKEHDITPKDKPYLVYQNDYISKTVPGVFTSRPGGKRGKYIRKKAVHHPGFEGRKFDEKIRETWQPKFKRRIEAALRRAAKKSGHGL